MKLERRNGSALDTADTVLAVVVGVIAVMAVLWIVSWVFSTLFFLLKLAIVGLAVAGIVSIWSRFKS